MTQGCRRQGVTKRAQRERGRCCLAGGGHAGAPCGHAGFTHRVKGSGEPSSSFSFLPRPRSPAPRRAQREGPGGAVSGEAGGWCPEGWSWLSCTVYSGIYLMCVWSGLAAVCAPEGRPGTVQGQATGSRDTGGCVVHAPRGEKGRDEAKLDWGATRIPRPLSLLPSLAPSFSFLTCLLSRFLIHSLPPVLVFVQNTLLPSFYLTCG